MDFGRVIEQATPMLLAGAKVTIEASIWAIILGIAIGLITCLMGMSKIPPLRWISAVYVWVIRGTPMLVQAFLIFFGVPQLLNLFVPGFRLTPLVAGIITLSVNAGAYLAEIFRGGISAVPKGQTEAARSLGLGYGRTMVKVVLPQAVKIALPSMVNQFIITIKDTSILSVIALPELTNKTRTYVGGTSLFFESYTYAALFYLVIISVLMIISRRLEESISYDRKN
ncbi:MAG: HEQRo perm amino transporter, permease protein, region, His/Glu/Gln/Arg/opine family [Firmicutes bacterium]|nr:HEQRo perm amino transporter, permease protein, region, His/Glu/Gln/Arg/opine family [Bacillota bacterium]